MPHLGTIRKGWAGENLARFILYKFSFVAHPSTIADDIGSDFFCTLFQVHRKQGHDYLLPQNSFTIQVKSNKNSFDVSNKLQYLKCLEIPFFVGVVNQKNLGLTIYSGEHIPLFFSHVGVPKKLKIELYESSIPAFLGTPGKYYNDSQEGSFVLRFPKIVEFSATTEGEELKSKVTILSEVCTSIYQNITSKTNGGYIFKDSAGNTTIVASSVSAQVYRNNLVDRLAEAFVNLQRFYKREQDKFVEQEFRIYESCYQQLDELCGPLPEYVEIYYQQLKELIDGA